MQWNEKSQAVSKKTLTNNRKGIHTTIILKECLFYSQFPDERRYVLGYVSQSSVRTVDGESFAITFKRTWTHRVILIQGG